MELDRKLGTPATRGCAVAGGRLGALIAGVVAVLPPGLDPAAAVLVLWVLW